MQRKITIMRLVREWMLMFDQQGTSIEKNECGCLGMSEIKIRSRIQHLIISIDLSSLLESFCNQIFIALPKNSPHFISCIN